MKRLTRTYHFLLKSRSQNIPFVIFAHFLATFIVTRVYVYITRHDLMNLDFLTDFVVLGGSHIHHFSWGIFLLAITGFLAIWNVRPAKNRALAKFYGIGLGLTFDEFAMWFRFTDNYQARLTYDALVIITLIFLNIIYFPGFWQKTLRLKPSLA